MSIEISLMILVGFMVGVFFHMLISSKRIRLLSAEIDRLRMANEDKSASELTVVTYPYEEVFGDDGIIYDERKAEIGYKFQLFISGVPCFEAHKIPVKTLSKKEVNPEKIEKALTQTIGLIEAIAAKNPAIQALKTAPDLLK